MESNLKPCPFCGSAMREENIWEHSQGGYYQVQCEICGSMTDFFFGRDIAIEKWNRRTSEVVRCKDCKHYDKDALWCNKNSYAFGEEYHNWYGEDFCSYGERKR